MATSIDNPLLKLGDIAANAVAFMEHVGSRLAAMDVDWRYASEQRTEQLRSEVALFERAMDRAHKFLTDWAKLGFDERMVQVEEHQLFLSAEMLRRVLTFYGLEGADVMATVRRVLLEVESGAPAEVDDDADE